MSETTELWQKFEAGDHLEDQEIKLLIAEGEGGLQYLRSRGEHLAAAKTAMDLERLRGYLSARRSG